ncbi:dihydropteroate synthase [bacterium]|nr:dihydropteroate synthase [bacterium]
MASKQARIWSHRTGSLKLGGRTLIMGVLNVTPDSFSDGGRYFSAKDAIQRALSLQEAGADILDMGAESTRPGSLPVSADAQIERLLPVLEGLGDRIRIPVSVDTSSAQVAGTCIAAGASIVNDISGFRNDGSLPAVCAQARCGVVLMHIKGMPKDMQDNTDYSDLLAEVSASLRESCKIAVAAGIPRESIVVDPGIGFGKNFRQNYLLLGKLRALQGLAQGVLVGTSRKAFTGEFSGLPAESRQYPTAATVAISILNGADIVRVHDVYEMKQVRDICDRYREVNTPNA